MTTLDVAKHEIRVAKGDPQARLIALARLWIAVAASLGHNPKEACNFRSSIFRATIPAWSEAAAGVLEESPGAVSLQAHLVAQKAGDLLRSSRTH